MTVPAHDTIVLPLESGDTTPCGMTGVTSHRHDRYKEIQARTCCGPLFSSVKPHSHTMSMCLWSGALQLDEVAALPLRTCCLTGSHRTSGWLRAVRALMFCLMLLAGVMCSFLRINESALPTLESLPCPWIHCLHDAAALDGVVILIGVVFLRV